MILAIDPGTVRVGWALVDNLGMARGQGILSHVNWDDQLKKLVALDTVQNLVLGDGTNRMNIEQGLKRLFPQVEVAVVDESASTVDAWRLKRREEAGRNPFLHLWFILRQLFVQVPVDDYAARVLAERYQKRGPAAK